MVFYSFNHEENANWDFKIGAGVGLSYLRAKGSMIVNDPNGAEVKSIDGSDFSYAQGIIISYEYKRFITQIKSFQSRGTINGIDLNLHLPTFAMGYLFEI